MNAATKYLVDRLGEHSTQVALAADIGAVASGLQGAMTWQNVLAVVIGSIVPIFIPNYTK